MDNRRRIGPGSAAIKYDILTALTVFGLNGSKADQLSMSRLVCLITARYNWSADTITVGQREMSRIWGVGERTAKREVKRWLDTGIVLCTQAGVRGRVASYRLNIPRICEVTAPAWERIGSDFAARMQAMAPASDRVVSLETVRANMEPRQMDAAAPWEAVLALLESRYPSQYAAWLAPLQPREDDGRLILDARSAFAAEYVKTHFGRDIAEAVASEWSRDLRVVIRGIDQRRV